QKFSHISSLQQEDFNTNLFVKEHKDISDELVENYNDIIDSSKELSDCEDIDIDSLEESNNSININDNFSEEFISNDLYSECILITPSNASNSSRESSDDEDFFSKIVNKASEFNNLLQSNSEFLPYFENITAALLFSTTAYDDLVDIMNNPNFDLNHVPVNILAKKTSSNSKNIKKAYYLSINDIIWHVLNNSSLMKYMYFGPGQEVNKKTCQASKEQLTNNNLDLAQLLRYCHITKEQLNEVLSVSTARECEIIMTKYGLCKKAPVLSQLIWDQHLQILQDIYHMTSDKVMHLLNLTVDLFSPKGQISFLKAWKSFEYPTYWGKLPNPISHYKSFIMSIFN
ncbi:1987_t:CDS:2, partial [Cetraspora pellucida]